MAEERIVAYMSYYGNGGNGNQVSWRKPVTTGQMQRWNYIDLLEVVGIFFVVFYHATTYNYNFIEKSAGIRYFYYFLRAVLSAGVPIFFFANGYLLLNRSYDLKKHIIKSVRIVILTFVWAIISVLLLMPIKNEYLSLTEFADCIWNWNQGWIKHLWYMGALVCIYVFFPLIKEVYDHNRKVFYYFTILAACFTFGNTCINHVASIALGIVGRGGQVYDFNWFNMFHPLRGIHGYTLVYFCVGGLAYDLQQKIEQTNALKRNILAACVILISTLLLTLEGVYFSTLTGEVWDVVWDGYDSVFTFINVCSLFVIALSYKKEYAWIRLISANTLGIYFIHQLFVYMFKPMVKTVPVMCTYIGGAVFTAALVLLSLGVVLLLKKVPLVKQLFML